MSNWIAKPVTLAMKKRGGTASVPPHFPSGKSRSKLRSTKTNHRYEIGTTEFQTLPEGATAMRWFQFLNVFSRQRGTNALPAAYVFHEQFDDEMAVFFASSLRRNVNIAMAVFMPKKRDTENLLQAIEKFITQASVPQIMKILDEQRQMPLKDAELTQRLYEALMFLMFLGDLHSHSQRKTSRNIGSLIRSYPTVTSGKFEKQSAELASKAAASSVNRVLDLVENTYFSPASLCDSTNQPLSLTESFALAHDGGAATGRQHVYRIVCEDKFNDLYRQHHQKPPNVATRRKAQESAVDYITKRDNFALVK